MRSRSLPSSGIERTDRTRRGCFLPLYPTKLRQVVYWEAKFLWPCLAALVVRIPRERISLIKRARRRQFLMIVWKRSDLADAKTQLEFELKKTWRPTRISISCHGAISGRSQSTRQMLRSICTTLIESASFPMHRSNINAPATTFTARTISSKPRFDRSKQRTRESFAKSWHPTIHCATSIA